MQQEPCSACISHRCYWSGDARECGCRRAPCRHVTLTQQIIPEKTKGTARQVVRKVVEELERKLSNPLIEAVRGSLNRAVRNSRRVQRDRLAEDDSRQFEELQQSMAHHR